MITSLINKMVASEIIDEEEKALYEYGMKQGLILLFNIATTILIAFLFDMIWQTVLFMIAYIPLRSYVGGYHAKTQTRCYFFSIALIIAVLIFMQHSINYNLAIVGLTAIGSIVIWKMAPVAAENKPLTMCEYQVYRKRGRAILYIELITILISLCIGLVGVALCIELGIIVAGVMIILVGKENGRNLSEDKEC